MYLIYCDEMRNAKVCQQNNAVYVLGAKVDTRLQRALYIFLRGDDHIHQLSTTSTLREGLVCDGSGSVDDNIRTAAAGDAAAVMLPHYNRQKQT